MSHSLPLLHVDLAADQPRVPAGAIPVVTRVDMRRLIQLDDPIQAVHQPVDRLVPLSDGRFAVGRRGPGRCLWRLMDADLAQHLDHPAWLWNVDAWFNPAVRNNAPIPDRIEIRALLRAAAPCTGGDRRLLHKSIATVVRGLRTRKSPVQVVVSDDILKDPTHPARALVLALVSVLPPTWSQQLRISIGEPSPSPRDWDIVVNSKPHPGFVQVDVTKPAGEGQDLPAFFVRNRLNADDVETLERAAFLFDGDHNDWAKQIRDSLRQGQPGVSLVTPEMLRESPEQAVRALCARIRAGSPLDGPLLEQLVEVTQKTADARPWVLLTERPSAERKAAVLGVLQDPTKVRPNKALADAFAKLYPKGASVEPWCVALLTWLRSGAKPAAVLPYIERALQDWATADDRTLRATVWAEVLQILVDRKLYADAVKAAVGDVAHQLVHEESGEVLAALWCTLPRDRRNPRHLRTLVGWFAEVDDLDAAAHLFNHIQDHPAEVGVVINAWVQASGSRALDPDDPILQAVWYGDHLPVFLRNLVQTLGGQDLIQAFINRGTDPADGAWVALEQVVADTADYSPRDRFTALHWYTAGHVALEAHARGLVEGAILESAFPDPEIAAVAMELDQVAGASMLWRWLAVTAAGPEELDEEAVDTAVLQVLADPPNSQTEQQLVVQCAMAMGLGGEWDPVDHARWIVRLSMLDEAADRDLAQLTATHLVKALAARPDGVAWLVAITQALFALPEDHVSLHTFLNYLLPHAWEGPLPPAFVHGVQQQGVPPHLMALWHQTLQHAHQ